MWNMLKKLFSSRKWTTALAAIVVDVLIFLTLPTDLAVRLVAFITITVGIAIGSEAVIDAVSANNPDEK